MQNTPLAAGLARRRYAKKRVTLVRAERQDSLALLLAALSGESRQNRTVNTTVAHRQPGTSRAEVSFSRVRVPIASAVDAQVSHPIAIPSPVEPNESRVEPRREMPCPEERNATPGIEPPHAEVINNDDTRRVEERIENVLVDSTDPIGEPAQPTWEPRLEPPFAPEPETRPSGDVRRELLAEVRELLRGQAARESEERTSQALAQSRARLASYR